MTTLTVERTIHAPVERVFRAVTDIGALPSTNPDILRIEFLSERRTGVGTRFRETRRMGKKGEHVTELEVTEYTEGAHARMVTRDPGTVWDTCFGFDPTPEGTRLTLRMEARAKSFGSRFALGLFKPLIRRGIEKHLTQLGAHCESTSQG